MKFAYLTPVLRMKVHHITKKRKKKARARPRSKQRACAPQRTYV